MLWIEVGLPVRRASQGPAVNALARASGWYASMIVKELFRIQYRPHRVLDGGATVAVLEKGEQAIALERAGRTTHRGQIQLVDDHLRRLVRIGPLAGLPGTGADLGGEFGRVHQVERLGDAWLVAALAFAD